LQQYCLKHCYLKITEAHQQVQPETKPNNIMCSYEIAAQVLLEYCTFFSIVK
jgi:hypothetical protein